MNTYGASDLGLMWGIGAVLRHRWKAAATFGLVLGVVALGLHFAERSYQSEAKLFIRIGRESVALDPTATIGQTIAVHDSRQYEINSAVELLESRVLLDKVVDQLTPSAILSSNTPQDARLAHEAAVSRLQRAVRVAAARNSSVISVRAEAASPELAQRVVHVLLEAFHELHTRMNQTAGSKEFFANREDQLREDLDDAVNELREAKNAAGVGTVEGRRELIQSHIAAAEADARRAVTLQAAAQAKVSALTAMIGGATPRFLAEDKQRQTPRLTTDSQHPTLERLTQDLLIETAEVESLKKQVEATEHQRADLLDSLKTLNNQAVRIADLERRHDMVEASFRQNHEHLEQARIEEQLAAQRVSNINVAQPPALTLKPVSPKPALTVALGTVAALCGAIAVALLAQLRVPPPPIAKRASRGLVLSDPETCEEYISARPESLLAVSESHS